MERLQRVEEAIVVATGAPRERGCPPWVVWVLRPQKHPASAPRDGPGDGVMGFLGPASVLVAAGPKIAPLVRLTRMT